MNRWASDRDDPAGADIRRVYQRTLAKWAFDVISARPRIGWPEGDPHADYRNRNWASLYAGSVLDD